MYNTKAASFPKRRQPFPQQTRPNTPEDLIIHEDGFKNLKYRNSQSTGAPFSKYVHPKSTGKLTSYLITHHTIKGRDSSVGIATSYGPIGPGIESRWGRDFPHPSSLALEPTQPPI